MNGKEIINIFNQQLEEIIDQAKTTFSDIIEDNKQIEKLTNAIHTTISITPSVPIKIFYKNFAAPFNKQINDRNDGFFLKFEVDDDIFELLKYIYKNTTDDNKDIIWNYILRLKNLSVKYYDKKNEPLYHEL